MVFLQDITIGEGEAIPPSTRFVKTWRVQNPGPDRWPPGCVLRYFSWQNKKFILMDCYLSFTTGVQLAFQDRVVVDALDPYTATGIYLWASGILTKWKCNSKLKIWDCNLKPFEMRDLLSCLDISVEMTSPSTPGMYESKWRMSTATGNFFGYRNYELFDFYTDCY